MSSSFVYIQPKNSLAKDTETHKLVSTIVEKISEIPKYHEHKHDLELLKMVCLIIEHAIDNTGKKVKTDKKDIAFQVYTKLWTNLAPNDISTIDANIKFLIENNFIVKKSRWSIFKHSVCDWVNRKILN